MKIEGWNPNKFDDQWEDIIRGKLIECANVVADWARIKCPVGTISRPQAKGKPRWTEREPGTLRRSIRTVYKKTKAGKVWRRKRTNIRVYAGHYLAFYALFVEFGVPHASAQPFLRPALYTSIPEMRAIISGGTHNLKDPFYDTVPEFESMLKGE